VRRDPLLARCYSPNAVFALRMLAALLLLAGGAVAAAPCDRPNVLVILADDLGFADIGSYGAEIDTPHLDRLAAEGVRFTQFYNTAKCHSSRVSLLTGRWARQAGNRSMSRAVTLPEMLGTNGYFSAMTGKWHLTAEPTDFGFDRYFGHLSGSCDYYRGDATFRLNGESWPVPESGFYTTVAKVDYALEFLAEARSAAKPWFLYVAFNAPHAPLQPLRADYEKYLGRYDAGWDVVRQQRLARQQALGLFDQPFAVPPRPDHIPAWDQLPESMRTWESRRMAAYAALIDRLDQELGRLFANLEAHDEWQNTVILFLSDNGASPYDRRNVGSHLEPYEPGAAWNDSTGWAWVRNTPFRFYKQNQYEGGAVAPAIVHWPCGLGVPAGHIIHEPVHLVDVLPFVAEVTDSPIPASWPGREPTPLAGVSFAPLLAGQSLGVRPPIHLLYTTDRGLRDGDWKLVSFKSQAWELYNLAVDRAETHNLIAEQPAIAARMIQYWTDTTRDVLFAPSREYEPVSVGPALYQHELWSDYGAASDIIEDGVELLITDFATASQPAGRGSPIAMGGSLARGVQVSDLSAGPGMVDFRLDLTSDANQAEAPIFAAVSVGTNTAQSISEAVAAGEYLEFSVGGAGFLVLETLEFSFVKHGFSQFAGVAVRTSVDDFGEDLLNFAATNPAGVYPLSVDLSLDDAFDGVEQVTIRFYLFDSYTGNNNRRLGIDDVVLTGQRVADALTRRLTPLFGDPVRGNDDWFTTTRGGPLWHAGGSWWYHSALRWLAVDPQGAGHWLWSVDWKWLHVVAIELPWVWSADHGWIYGLQDEFYNGWTWHAGEGVWIQK
jgi:arylsulfatase A-like enzyme